jgi:hypothetical protein
MYFGKQYKIYYFEFFSKFELYNPHRCYAMFDTGSGRRLSTANSRQMQAEVTVGPEVGSIEEYNRKK